MYLFIRRILLPAVLFFPVSRPQQNKGLLKYGNVEFADSIHHKYPVDTPKHIRAAWAYIHRKQNAAKYSEKELEKIMEKIKNAAKAKGMYLRPDQSN